MAPQDVRLRLTSKRLDQRDLHGVVHRLEGRKIRRTLAWIQSKVGSPAGGQRAALWGGALILFSSAVVGAGGGIVGIWLGHRLVRQG